ncbi:MAG: hypothetical protein IJW47_00445 [Clostridia bacterium]|nr:hypothetical protein [Clostridia bacterium]
MDDLNFLPENIKTEVCVTEDKKCLKVKHFKEKTKKPTGESVNFGAFIELAELLNVSVEEIKDECCLFQVRNIMNRLGKVIARYNVTDKELEKILANCSVLNVKELLLTPAYIPTITRQIKKQNFTNVRVSAIIDFPFGESLFKSKLIDVRDSLKMGVDGVTVMMPAILLEQKNLKVFKKQCKKIGAIKKIDTAISLSPMELNAEQIKNAIKFVEKTKLKAVTFIFGDVRLEDFRAKMAEINKFRMKKSVRILANVETVQAVQELIKDNVDEILTPYADDLGVELVKRFGIKSVKLK